MLCFLTDSEQYTALHRQSRAGHEFRLADQPTDIRLPPGVFQPVFPAQTSTFAEAVRPVFMPYDRMFALASVATEALSAELRAVYSNPAQAQYSSENSKRSGSDEATQSNAPVEHLVSLAR